MSPMQRNPDGTWSPAEPVGYQPGWDIERSGRDWVLHRTSRTASVEVARGQGTMRLLVALLRARLGRGVHS